MHTISFVFKTDLTSTILNSPTLKSLHYNNLLMLPHFLFFHTSFQVIFAMSHNYCSGITKTCPTYCKVKQTRDFNKQNSTI